MRLNYVVWSETSEIFNLLIRERHIPVLLRAEPTNSVDDHAVKIVVKLPEWLIGGVDDCDEYRKIGYIARREIFKNLIFDYVTEHGEITAFIETNSVLDVTEPLHKTKTCRDCTCCCTQSDLDTSCDDWDCIPF